MLSAHVKYIYGERQYIYPIFEPRGTFLRRKESLTERERRGAVITCLKIGPARLKSVLIETRPLMEIAKLPPAWALVRAEALAASAYRNTTQLLPDIACSSLSQIDLSQWFNIENPLMSFKVCD